MSSKFAIADNKSRTALLIICMMPEFYVISKTCRDVALLRLYMGDSYLNSAMPVEPPLTSSKAKPWSEKKNCIFISSLPFMRGVIITNCELRSRSVAKRLLRIANCLLTLNSNRKNQSLRPFPGNKHLFSFLMWLSSPSSQFHNVQL